MAESSIDQEPPGAIRSCYLPPDKALRLDLSPQDIAAALAEPGGMLWVDVHTDGRPQGELILRDIFGFHPLTIDDCYNTLIDPPKIDDYGHYLFVILHEVTFDPVTETLDTQELNLYIGDNYVVSVHRVRSHAVEEVRRLAEQRSRVIDRGAAFLAHALMDVVADDFHPIVETIDDRVAALEERVLDAPGRTTLEQILLMKRTVQRLKRTILPQRDVLTRFSRGEYPTLIADEALMYFRDVYDHTVRVQDTIDSVRDLADGALNTYLSSVNNKTNEVMKILAIVTVVFLPLTLIASIYGTNFDETFPQYSLDAGFALMIGAMLAVAVALAFYFKWRRWF
jgi:magnesium transporter